MKKRALLRYFALEFHLKERELERILLEHQARGAFPIFKKGNMWIFEQYKVEEAEGSVAGHTARLDNAYGKHRALESITAI